MKPSALIHIVAATAALLLTAFARAEEDSDMHFRPFGIEPADRIAWGSGHVMTGVLHETRPERGTERRRTLPVEWTIGLPAGLSMVLSGEAMARTTYEGSGPDSGRTQEVLLKYSLPERDGFHLAVMTAESRLKGSAPRSSFGLSANLDTGIGTFGAGANWERRTPSEPHGGREAGINWFRLEHGWGLAAERRIGRTAAGERLNHWLFGVARVIGHGVLADLAVGSSHGDTSGRYVTAGVSWFY